MFSFRAGSLKNDAVNATAIATTKAPGDWPLQMSSKIVGPIMREGIAGVLSYYAFIQTNTKL